MTDTPIRLDLGQFFFDDPIYVEDAYEATLRAIPPYIGAWEPSDEFLSILYGVMWHTKRNNDKDGKGPHIIQAGQVVFWQEAYVVPLHETLFSIPFKTLLLPPTWSLYPSDALRHAFYKQEAVDGKLYRAYAKQFRDGKQRREIPVHQAPIIDLATYIKAADEASEAGKEP